VSIIELFGLIPFTFVITLFVPVNANVALFPSTFPPVINTVVDGAYDLIA